MKNIIILCFMIFLLLLFPLQNLKDVSTQRKITKFDLIVENTCEKAMQNGYFSTDIINSMKNEILTSFPELTSSDITYTVTNTPKYRSNVFNESEFIYYDISIPIKNVIAMREFFGISESDSTIVHRKKGYVLSEVNLP